MPPSGTPLRRGMRMPYSTFTKPITSRYDMSVCQSWPASGEPMYLPSSFRFDSVPTCASFVGIGRGTGSLDLAEAFRERAQIAHVELLIREAQHAMLAERQQDLGEVALSSSLRHVDAMNGRAEDCAGRFDGQHAHPPDGLGPF